MSAHDDDTEYDTNMLTQSVAPASRPAYCLICEVQRVPELVKFI